MQPIWVNAAALTVAVLFYTWRSYFAIQQRKQGLLRKRVAYMLWCAAEQVEVEEPVAAH